MNDVRYWDSCVYLRVLQRGEDCETPQAVLGRIEARERTAARIATSTFTLVEVLNRKGQGKILLPEDFARAGDLLSASFTRSLIPADEAVCRQARDFTFENNLRPLDAIHLASALARQIPVLETYDDDLLSQAEPFANRITIRRPLAPDAARLEI